MPTADSRVTVFTIGHSLHPWQDFLNLLRRHDIDVLVDVRSKPHSARAPHYSAPALTRACREAGLKYVQMGNCLGGRSDDSAICTDGRVDYDKLAQTPPFIDGLVRLARGVREHRVALMCAEKDPLICHRALLVARHLLPRLGPEGEIRHILAQGTTWTHKDLEAELMRLARIQDGPGLFEPRESGLSFAYRKQGQRIAFALREGPDAESQYGANES